MQSPKQLENYLYFEDSILGSNVGHSILFGIGKDVFQYNITNGKWICIQDYQNVKIYSLIYLIIEIIMELMVLGANQYYRPSNTMGQVFP